MLNNRAVTTVLIAALACAAECGTAHAAPAAPVPPDSRPAPRLSGATSVPVRGLQSLSALTHRRRANTQSTNWSGYTVTGSTYTSVAADWVEPDVKCTSDGTVGFWVGLDGWGSDSVEQVGTGVDCSSGSPQQFAWWETYPENSIQVYSAPVAAGDRMSAAVDDEGGSQYFLDLTDSTQNWTERHQVPAPTARDASAEIVAEAVSNGQSVTTLPDFGAVDFTGSTINGGSLQSADAQPVDMTDLNNNLIATTTAADPDGDFAVTYQGSTTQSGGPAAGGATDTQADGSASGREPLLSRLESLLARL